MSESPLPLPSFDKFIIPIVHALRALGGSASVDELNTRVIQDLSLSDEVATYRRKTASVNEVPYRMAWARTYLKNGGVLERTARGVWALTTHGREVSDADLKSIPTRVRKARPEVGQTIGDQTPTPFRPEETETWKPRLLDILKQLSPDAFERLAQRILRESGFIKVEVTGRTGDGGIDGTGVLRIQLVSFQVLFQCKRYKDTVGASAIRDFRGAMVGRTDKGLFITTGRFTADARQEATRDGAPPIELIDGDELCELLRSLRIGIAIEIVERVVIQSDILLAI